VLDSELLTGAMVRPFGGMVEGVRHCYTDGRLGLRARGRNLETATARGDLDEVIAAVTPLSARVSYSAAVVQLASLNKIDWQAAAELRTVRPLDLKRQIGGRDPDQQRAAVWLLAEADLGRHITVDVGDELYYDLMKYAPAAFAG
jgi:hypothetical protein